MSALTAAYPCCGKPCRVPNTPALPRETVERRHFCDPEQDTGTLWQVERRRLGAAAGVEVNAVAFLDLAGDEALHQYGARRVPRREAKTA